MPRMLATREKRLFTVAAIALVLSTLVLGYRFWLHRTTITPARGGEYTEALVGAPHFINPLSAPSNDVDCDITALVFSGLMKSDRDGNLVTDLASSYSMTDDQKQYTFVLRDNLTWHDGEPLTVDDIVYTIKTIQDPTYRSPLRVSFAGVDVKRIDTTTVTFTLKNPLPSFLSVLTVGIMPQHIWYSIPAANAHLAEANIKPVGSGPFQFKSLAKDANGAIRNMTFARNEQYYDQKPYLNQITFKFYSDFDSGVEALKNKNVDGLGYLPLEYAMDVATTNTLTVHELQQPLYTAMFFNPQKNATLKDRTVRAALALGLDRTKIAATAINGKGTVINGPLVNGQALDANAAGYTYDVDAANKKLDDAGWKRNATTTMRFKDTTPLAIKVTAVDQQDNAKTLTLIKEQWQALGIATTLDLVPRSSVRKDVIDPRNYDLLLFGQIIGYGQDPFALWHSSQTQSPGNNLSLVTNKDVDTLLEKIRSTKDAGERQKLYVQFQQKITDEVFAIFLYNPLYLYPQSRTLKGFGITALAQPSDRFRTIASWYTKSHRSFK